MENQQQSRVINVSLTVLRRQDLIAGLSLFCMSVRDKSPSHPWCILQYFGTFVIDCSSIGRGAVRDAEGVAQGVRREQRGAVPVAGRRQPLVRARRLRRLALLAAPAL